MVGREILVILFGAITTIGLFYIFREYSFGLDPPKIYAVLTVVMLSFIFQVESMCKKGKRKRMIGHRSNDLNSVLSC